MLGLKVKEVLIPIEILTKYKYKVVLREKSLSLKSKISTYALTEVGTFAIMLHPD